MFCPRCGAQSASKKFCRSCGTNLTGVSRVIEQPGQQSAISQAKTTELSTSEAATLGLFSAKTVSNRDHPMHRHNAGSVFGSVTVDLTAERLPEGETKITLFSVFGSAELLVADDVGIRITGFTCFATVSVRGKELGSGFGPCNYFSDNYEAASRRLHIEGTAVFAELKIKGRD